jgi:hypothetical protein
VNSGQAGPPPRLQGTCEGSVAEPHHFYAARVLAVPAPAPTLLYCRSKFFKEIKVNIRSDILLRLIPRSENCGKYAYKNAIQLFSYVSFLKTTHVEHRVLSRIRIVLRLRFHYCKMSRLLVAPLRICNTA